MAANDIGMGIVVTLKDLFSSGSRNVASQMGRMQGAAKRVTGSLGNMNTVLSAVAGSQIFQKSKQIFTGMINPAMQLDEALQRVKESYRLTGSELEQVQKFLQDTYIAYESTTLEGAKALFQMKSTFGSIGDAQKALLEVNKLMKAGNVDRETAQLAIEGTARAFHLGADQLERISNTLYVLKATGGGVATFQSTANGLRMVSSQAESLNIKLEDVAATLVAWQQEGVSQPKAYRGLSLTFQSLIVNSEKLDKAAQKFGFSSIQAAIDSKGFINTMYNLAKQAEFSKEKLVELGIPAASAGNFLKILDNNAAGAQGAFSKLNQQMLDAKLASIVDSFGESWEDVGKITDVVTEQLGTALLPVLKPIVIEMVSWLLQLRTWIHENPKFAKQIAVTVAVVAALGAALGVMAVTAAVVSAAIGLLTPVVTAIGSALYGVYAILGGLIVTFGAIPVAIGAAVLAAVGTIYYFRQEIWDAMVYVGDVIVSAFTKSIAWVSGAWDSFVGYISEKLKYIFGLIEEVTGKTFLKKDKFQVSVAHSYTSDQNQSAVANNVMLSSVRNPAITMPSYADMPSPVVKLQPQTINPAQVVLDKKVLGKVIFEMQNQTAVRGGN